MHMRTTINIDDTLLKAAADATGITEKTALVRLGLETLVRDAATKRLMALGGTMKDAKAGPRKRAWDRK